MEFQSYRVGSKKDPIFDLLPLWETLTLGGTDQELVHDTSSHCDYHFCQLFQIYQRMTKLWSGHDLWHPDVQTSKIPDRTQHQNISQYNHVLNDQVFNSYNHAIIKGNILSMLHQGGIKYMASRVVTRQNVWIWMTHDMQPMMHDRWWTKAHTEHLCSFELKKEIVISSAITWPFQTVTIKPEL